MAAIEPGLDLLLNAGLTRLRKKSLHLQEYMLFLIENRLSDSGFTVASPINSRERGSHLTLNHVNAGAICQALIHPPKHKPAIIPDFRAPNSIRFGIAPLYVSYEDIWIAIERLAEIIADAEYKTFPNTPAGVT
jgi:kynureninase